MSAQPASEIDEVPWPSLLSALIDGVDLGRERAFHVMAAMLSGQATDAQIGGFLVGLAAKGETTEELLGMREAMFAVSTPIDLPAGTIDIVGVGGSPRRRVAAFNASTLASIVASAAGATVCKHGNRKASSTSGSFDLLEALGVNIEASPEVVASGVHKLGIGFVFARAYHPAMRHVGPARAQLGVPSVFNVLGPLAHPGRVKRQVIGVPNLARARQVGEVLAGTDAELVWVVHGHDDLDELSLSGPSDVIEVRRGVQREFVVDAAQFGLAAVAGDAIEGGDAERNAQIARQVLAGEASANRDMVVLNAAAGLVVAGVADDLESGIGLANKALDDGAAAAKLDDLVRHTNT